MEAEWKKEFHGFEVLGIKNWIKCLWEYNAEENGQICNHRAPFMILRFPTVLDLGSIVTIGIQETYQSMCIISLQNWQCVSISQGKYFGVVLSDEQKALHWENNIHHKSDLQYFPANWGADRTLTSHLKNSIVGDAFSLNCTGLEFCVKSLMQNRWFNPPSVHSEGGSLSLVKGWGGESVIGCVNMFEKEQERKAVAKRSI